MKHYQKYKQPPSGKALTPAINAAWENADFIERRELERIADSVTTIRNLGDSSLLELLGKLGAWLARQDNPAAQRLYEMAGSVVNEQNE